MTMLDRIQSVKDNLTLDGDYEYELQELQSIEGDIPVYRHMGTPVWKTQQAKQEIQQVRVWIQQELEHRNNA